MKSPNATLLAAFILAAIPACAEKEQKEKQEERGFPWREAEIRGEADLMLGGSQGIEEAERETFLRVKDILLVEESIFSVETYLAAEGAYYVETKEGWLKFRRKREDGKMRFEDVEGEGTPFPCDDPAAHATVEDEIAAGENPSGTNYAEQGYEEGDPRVVFIESEDQCHPFFRTRIAQLFDSPNAPDLHYSLVPYGANEVGTHGNLDVTQSRTALMFSGAGVKRECGGDGGGDDGPCFSDLPASSADIAPTVLALLGGECVEGVNKEGYISSCNLMRWQDGDVLDEIMAHHGGAEYAVIILYDGLNSAELVHQIESRELDLPNFFRLAGEGVLFRYGAIAGYPSVTSQGHYAVGTGAFGGHSGIFNNGMFNREQAVEFSPTRLQDALLGGDYTVDEFLGEFSLFYRDGVETIYEAVHRSFGTAGDGVYAVSINELTFGGADFSLLDLLEEKPEGRGGAGLDEVDSVDRFAVVELQNFIRKNALPKVAFISFYSTDFYGHAFGPHADQTRGTFTLMDELLGQVFKLYEAEGAFEKTLFVITSDHGMELQDMRRASPWLDALDEAGISYLDPDRFGCVYLIP